MSGRWFVIHDRKILSEHPTETDARNAYRDELNKGWRVCGSASVYRAPSRALMEADLAKVVQIVCFGSGAGYWDDHERIYRCAACGAETKDCDTGIYCRVTDDEHDWHGHDVLREKQAV